MRLRLLNSAAAVLLAVPGISHGLALGEIQLKSTLNAPLNAEIELTATDEELTSLRTQLASRDTFTRYGLDYPSFLSAVQVRIVRQGGRVIIQLTSATPITEPFATFLVEARWTRGVLQREYTVLFDPPAFAPQQPAPPPPVAAPVAGATRGNEITRPAAPATPAAAVRPSAPAPVVPAAPVAAAGGNYTVPRGDSLSAIAARQYGEAAAEQAMVAIYRANPQAFGGNINQLRAGAVLRMPEPADVAALDRAQSVGEIRRQMAEWSGRAAEPANAASAPRLVLVPPGGTAGTGTAAGSSTTPASGAAAGGAAPAATDNRLQLGTATQPKPQGNAATPPEVRPADAAAPAAEKPVPAEAPAAQAQPAVPAAEPVAPVAEPKPAPKVEAKPAAAPVAEGPSLLDQLKAFWFVPAGLVALLALLLGARAVRRRREAAAADGFAPFAVEPTLARERDTTADTLPLRKSAEPRDTSIVVEENTVPRASATTRKESPRTVDLDETPADKPSIESTGAFEQGDPLAEADFHMAYGLYDQAADLVKLAIAREPSRRDLKLKLLEVYFVWGNKDQFLQTARDLAESRDAAQPGEWEKVVIMGKQLAPEDPLFTQSAGGVGASSVDLNLEGGQNLVDFDLPSEPSGRLPQLGDGMQADAGLSGLDFVLDDPARGADTDAAATQSTQQLQVPGYSIDGPTVEQPFNFDGPTVEQPALGIDDTLAGKLGARRAPVGGTDQTAELALDDLGLDLGKLEATGTNLLDDSQLAPILGSGDVTGSSEQVSETLVAGLDDTARQLLQQADNSEATELMPISELGTGDTSRVAGLDLNFDLGNEIDGNAATGKRLAPDFSLDLDIGDAEPAGEGEYTRTQRIDPATVVDADATQRDLEPVSMSEVGTKLDLARAYMDMGDPDGARSILGEVLAEGSPAQRQEAQRLLDSIPG